MNLMDVVHQNWKAVVVGVSCLVVGIYAGPIASKAVGIVLPKALQHVSNQPIEDVLHGTNPLLKDAIPEPPSAQEQAAQVALQLLKKRLAQVDAKKVMLADVARSWGIEGRLSCSVVTK